jgi:hypothetical protein
MKAATKHCKCDRSRKSHALPLSSVQVNHGFQQQDNRNVHDREGNKEQKKYLRTKPSPSEGQDSTDEDRQGGCEIIMLVLY